VSGALSAVFSMVGNMTMGFADVPIEVMRARRPKTQSASAAPPSVNTNDSSGSRYSPIPTEEETDGRRLGFDAVSTNVTFRTLHEKTTSSVEIPQKEPLSSEKNHQALSSQTGSSSSNTRGTALNITNGIALGASKGLGRIMLAGFKSPFEVSLHVARGFHNLPKLYGDKTVRPHDQITGVWSGLKAAGKVSNTFVQLAF
jgi:hypothetical protein